VQTKRRLSVFASFDAGSTGGDDFLSSLDRLREDMEDSAVKDIEASAHVTLSRAASASSLGRSKRTSSALVLPKIGEADADATPSPPPASVTVVPSTSSDSAVSSTSSRQFGFAYDTNF
jgi:hypothetical protein